MRIEDDTLPRRTTTIDSALSSSSTNPVQNKVIQAELANKISSSDVATTESNGLMSSTDKSKLDSLGVCSVTDNTLIVG